MTTPSRMILLTLLVVALLSPRADACSTFCFESQGGPIFGKNYDWDVEVGLVIVNKRGVEKASVTTDNPAEWRSRYGSVTFNQYGREFPSGGMNEPGLVVELMWLDDTEYPAPDERASVSTLQWIQYQLDNSATVADVIASDEHIRITENGTPIHFLVADDAGGCAAIEFLRGKLVAHTGESMPMQALTNHSYEASLMFAGRFGGGAQLPRSSRSLDRFMRASRMAEGFVGEPAAAVKHAFGILDDVAQGDHTKWSIVYDTSGRRVYFRTHAHRPVREIDLDFLDFDCATPVTMIDINAPLQLDITAKLVPYSREANLELITTAFRQTSFLSDTAQDILEQLSRVPDGMACVGQRVAAPE